MKRYTLILYMVILTGIVSGPVFSGNAEPLVEATGKGYMNWSSGFVRATGVGVPPDWAAGKPQARPLALTAARMAAYRNLLDIVQRIPVDSTTTVKTIINADSSIHAQVDSMIREAEVISKVYKADETVEVTIQLHMTGGFAQLILPVDIKHVEPVNVIGSGNQPLPDAGSNPDSYTGLVVDARGLDIKPVMAPKILSETGEEVYGPAYVSREHAVQQGMCGYYTDIDKASAEPRVSGNPLVVKGIKKTASGHYDMTISNADAAILRSAPENLSFLRRCRVIIVVDEGL